MEKKKLKFRPNVGLMIINKEGKVWLGVRANGGKINPKYGLQMPQGGIDAGEQPVNAAYRELFEETGLTRNHVKLLKSSRRWYAYTFPQPINWGNTTYDGQRQKWFLFLHTGSESDFNLNAHPEEIEFCSYGWYAPNDVPKSVIPFKRPVYRRIITEFLPVIEQVNNKHSKPQNEQ